MDVWISVSYYILAIPISVFFLFLISLHVSEPFNKLWFSWVYTVVCTSIVKHGSDSIRAKLFEKLSRIQSSNSEIQLVILEIGPARGNNFEFYPPNCNLIALDHNSYFEKYFLENKSKFPHIICENFIEGTADNMRQIDDNSVDVVVATYVLCSVKDRCKALKEIKRVLKEGGTYFFIEHVGYPLTSVKHVLVFAFQLLVQPLWYMLGGGCHCYRHSWSHIERAGFQSLNLNYEYPKEMILVTRGTIWGTATTYKAIDSNYNNNDKSTLKNSQ